MVRRAEDGTVETLAERVTVDARAHAEQLTPNVLGAVSDAGISVADLDAVVVGCGPGPFTGLRVGMASAAAFGHALGVPVHGVCSLDAIGVHTDGDVLVVTDARRREVATGRTTAMGSGGRPVGQRARRCASVLQTCCRGGRFARARRAVRPAPGRGGVSDTGGAGTCRHRLGCDPQPLVPLYRAVLTRNPLRRCANDCGGRSSTRADASRCAELEAKLFAGDDPWPARAFPGR